MSLRGLLPGPRRTVSSSTLDVEIGIDDLLETLRNERRRLVIRELAERDKPVTIDTLSRRLAAIQNDVDEDDVTATQRKRVYVSLYQTHLNRLEDAGLLEWDGREIAPTRGTELAMAVLEDVDERLGGAA